MKIRMASVAAVLLLSLSACMDLDITNTDAADRARALSEPGDVESLISGTFRTWWDLQQGRAPGPAMASMADEITGSQANYGFQDQGMEPAVPIINVTAYQWGYWVYDPWLLSNRALASIRDGLQSISDLDLQIGPNGADTQRAIAFAKFMQGLFLGNIALQYDQGIILDEDVVDPTQVAMVPYDQVMDAALQKLSEARDLAAANTFTIPSGWMGTDSYTSARLVQLTHSYQARYMALVARTPQERGQVDWNGVLGHINQGVDWDFGVNLDGSSGVWGAVLKGFMGDGWDTDLALLGPADQSGAYLAYEASAPESKGPFLIDTDDRRIHGATQTDPGVYVHYRANIIQPAERGLHYQSNYAPWWYYDLAQTGFGFAPELTVVEMGFLKAEAYIRTGQPDLALPFINDRRVAVGQLPAATVTGVSGARCVPRSAGLLAKASNVPAGDCGDLLQTLIYEKQIETAFQFAGSSWYDHRGFGTLRTGRAYQCPVPEVDLALMGIDPYTFGGVGGASSAS
ncbi:MAG: hypothetical protein OEZ65_14185 [Gemmatimonadota bacterium]|nr:hypothetical protein [Gemmatimonadota bacterium]MDH5760733.1 hypothetical protein [Gemmatimonadota bacterium]